MDNIAVPTGYQRVMPYLILMNAQGFLAFMQKVFNATEKYKVMRDETTVMHGELQVGESTIMFADATEQYTSQPAGMFIYVADADETYKNAIQEGATSIIEMCDQSYGRSGGVKDPFGNVWWITAVK